MIIEHVHCSKAGQGMMHNKLPCGEFMLFVVCHVAFGLSIAEYLDDGFIGVTLCCIRAIRTWFGED